MPGWKIRMFGIFTRLGLFGSFGSAGGSPNTSLRNASRASIDILFTPNFESKPLLHGAWRTAEPKPGCYRLAVWSEKFGISSTAQRGLHFLAQSIVEPGYLRLVKEGDGERRIYIPYYGRGLIQITFAREHKVYGNFRAFPQTEVGTARYPEVGGWNPDVVSARR